MRLYKQNTVYEEGLKRIRYLFDEFDEIVVSVSGGKDSDVVFNLSLQVAKEKNRLPLNVMFIDQEAELQSTIDMITTIMEMKEVKPYWYQFPFKLFNATSPDEPWIQCWDSEKEDVWMRKRVPYSFKENIYGTDRFKKLFTNIISTDFPPKTANIGGVRAEESPARLLAMTGSRTYKGETWGKFLDRENDKYTFYPIYDWSYTDVWKAIHDNGWEYNKIYDKQFSWGVPINDMRVSALCHETSVSNLRYLQECELDTWQNLTRRLKGIDTEGKFGLDLKCPVELPFMFNTWHEYRNYLADKMLPNNDMKVKIIKKFKNFDTQFGHVKRYYRVCITTIIKCDWEGTLLDNYRVSQNLMRKEVTEDMYV